MLWLIWFLPRPWRWHRRRRTVVIHHHYHHVYSAPPVVVVRSSRTAAVGRWWRSLPVRTRWAIVGLFVLLVLAGAIVGPPPAQPTP